MSEGSGRAAGLSLRARFLVIAAVAVAIRAVQFGNPVIQIDEQFYLLVGDRMLHGALPFVDFWDRKPYGLFLIYAAIRSLGGDGILAYQLVATVCAALTAFVVSQLAGRIAPPRGALIAAIVYLLYLSVNGGDGGQAPVFYNLPVALAAWLIVRAVERSDWDWRATLLSTGAMALIGVALQIKYSVLFEGVFFGVTLMVIAWRRGLGPVRVGLLASLWVILALAPTGLVLLGYWRIGHFDTLWFTNFQSVLLRPRLALSERAARLAVIGLKLAPILAAAVVGARATRSDAVARLLAGWAMAAIAGLLLFGTYHDHYALPLVLPLSVLGAAAYANLKRGIGPIPWAAVALVPGALFVTFNTTGLRGTRGDGTTVRALAATIRAGPNPSLFIFRGDPVLYYLTGARIPTAYNFPTLLSEAGDGTTLGVDQVGELRRTMARRPRFVLLYTPPSTADNPASWSVMRSELAAHYRMVESEQVGHRTDMLYELRER